MVDAVKRLEAAENLCQEIITEEIQIAKRAEVAVTGFLRSLVYAAGFDVLVWTRISRQSGMECSTLKPLVTVTLGFLALGTMLSAFCAYRKVQKISTHASCLLHRLRGVTVLLASFPQDGGEESKALQKCNIVASYLLHRLRHVAELLKNFLRGGGNASPAGNQSVSPAAATAEYNPTPTASGESEIKLNNLRKMRRELSFQLKWLRAIYLWRIFFLLIPMLLLITWELAFVDKCCKLTISHLLIVY